MIVKFFQCLFHTFNIVILSVSHTFSRSAIYFIINTISKLFTLALVPLVYRPKITDHS